MMEHLRKFIEEAAPDLLSGVANFIAMLLGADA